MRRFGTASLVFCLAIALGGCTAVSVATTAVGVGVGVASTGVRVGVGTTVRAADFIIPDGNTCEDEVNADHDAEDGSEDEDCREED